MSIVDTDLAPVASSDTDLYLYYQDSQGAIIETHSSDGSSWQKSSEPVATNARQYPSSPVTAYYVQKDANFGNKSTIHVFYLDTTTKLTEKVRDLSGSSWEDGTVPDDISKAVMEESRLTGSSYNGPSGWNPTGSQWAYFHQFTGGVQQITEIRRTPYDPIHAEAILPESDALSDSSLAVCIFQGGIDLFFQDHEQNVAVYANRDSSWQDKKILIPSDAVQAETPIAAARSSETSGTEHLLVADQSKTIQHYADGQLVDSAEQYYPGTRLGAVLQNDKLVLFYKSLNPAGAVYTKVYDDGTWKDGVQVVPAY